MKGQNTHHKSIQWIKDNIILLSTPPHTFDRIDRLDT